MTRKKNVNVELPIELGIFVATAGIILFSQLLHRKGSNSRSSDVTANGATDRQRNHPTKDENHHRPTDEVDTSLPSHVKREIRKEERRQKMIPLFTMKKPMYDNVFLTCPEHHVLGTISNKKAEWYIQKNLAAWVEEAGDKRVLQLNFTPSGRVSDRENNGGGDILYNTSAKRNCCVSCGSDAQGYSRHYIVPYSYRSFFPLHHKTHLPHDIVILCPTCHVRAEQHSHWRMRRLEQEARRALPGSSELPHIVDQNLKQVRTAANALLKYRAQLPAKRIEEFEGYIREWGNGRGDVDAALLQTAAAIDYQRPNPKYVTGPSTIAYSLGLSDHGDTHQEHEEDKITQFVQAWRQHFLDVMQPRHLPPGWSVHAAVQSDRRKGSIA